MWIAKNNDLIILAKDTKAELESALCFMVYTTIEETDVDYVLYNGTYLTEEQALSKEQERIQSLCMTRSDFFDGTIKAFGADSDDLLTAIEGVLSTVQISKIEKKVAISNYKNALNFYRKHPLFTLLTDVPIPISQNTIIQITSEQWDNFFDETNKKNPDAYKELMPAISVVTPPGEEVEPEVEEETEENIESEVENEEPEEEA